MSRLKNLYTQLMEEPWLRSWHDDYQAFYKEVEKIHTQLKDPNNQRKTYLQIKQIKMETIIFLRSFSMK